MTKAENVVAVYIYTSKFIKSIKSLSGFIIDTIKGRLFVDI